MQTCRTMYLTIINMTDSHSVLPCQLLSPEINILHREMDKKNFIAHQMMACGKYNI